MEAFEAEMDTYQSNVDTQAIWLREEACAKAILLASKEVDISLWSLHLSVDVGSPSP